MTEYLICAGKCLAVLAVPVTAGVAGLLYAVPGNHPVLGAAVGGVAGVGTVLAAGVIADRRLRP